MSKWIKGGIARVILYSMLLSITIVSCTESKETMEILQIVDEDAASPSDSTLRFVEKYIDIEFVTQEGDTISMQNIYVEYHDLASGIMVYRKPDSTLAITDNFIQIIERPVLE
jgi:hypothetical protein